MKKGRISPSQTVRLFYYDVFNAVTENYIDKLVS